VLQGFFMTGLLFMSGTGGADGGRAERMNRQRRPRARLRTGPARASRAHDVTVPTARTR
jgi:hypothetical protein